MNDAIERTPMTGGPIDPAGFRQALGSFVTGVTIVTTRSTDGGPVGLTANSFNSVSLDPPMVLWSLALKSPSLTAFQSAKYWAVHILAADQETLSAQFATRGIDKFAGIMTESGPGDVPLLSGCAARFICRTSFEYDGGDHAIFVGEVIDFQNGEGRPLVFHGGRYNRILPPGQALRPREDEGQGAFGRYFTGHYLSLAHNAAFAELRREYRQRGLRASDYTLITALGLSDRATIAEVMERARRGGIDLPHAAIDRMIERGDVANENDHLQLTESGRRLLTELIAIAESIQLRFEERLSPQELSMLHELLLRLADAPAVSLA